MTLNKQTVIISKKLVGNLVYDYLSQKKEVRIFYNQFPDTNGFKQILSSKDVFKNIDRKLLVKVLKEQSSLVNNSNPRSLKNIELLSKENSFTVTTGHQLCLFTGPLYFIYKIFSVINLCEKLKLEFPENNFIPLYWMASEDHDFEEVNHLNVFGKKIVWNLEQSGSVGNFSTEGLGEIQKQLKDIFGENENTNYLLKLFGDAYIKNPSVPERAGKNLADATRYLVNELFGKYGIVILDGQNALLKKRFENYIKKDIFENVPFKKVSESIEYLKKLGYSSQVNPREINCFYSEPGLRARIEKDGTNYKVIGTDKIFSKTELEKLIETGPEKISPNVVLRPCYQQAILPNIAYVGGPGELAYWLEYKAMFDELKLAFPILVPRKFVTVLDSTSQQKIKKFGFSNQDLEEDEQTLIKMYLEKSNVVFQLEKYKKELEVLYSRVNREASEIDKTLSSAVEAEKQKSINALTNIEAKLNKALKQKSETEINQIKALKNKLFPNHAPQERFDNFSMPYLKWGPEFLNFLKESLEYDLIDWDQVFVGEE